MINSLHFLWLVTGPIILGFLCLITVLKIIEVLKKVNSKFISHLK